MYHCNGGLGANAFGGGGQRSGGTPPLAVDSKHDGKLDSSSCSSFSRLTTTVSSPCRYGKLGRERPGADRVDCRQVHKQQRHPRRSIHSKVVPCKFALEVRVRLLTTRPASSTRKRANTKVATRTLRILSSACEGEVMQGSKSRHGGYRNRRDGKQ